MRLRLDPLHAAGGTIAIVMATFLCWVTLAWQTSDETVKSIAPSADHIGGIDADGVAQGSTTAATDTPVALTPIADPPAVSAAPVPSSSSLPAPIAAPTTRRPTPRSTTAAAAVVSPFAGMGTWVDVYDWAPSYAKGQPVKLAATAVDDMADRGVQVLYIQVARADNPGAGDIVDPPVLRQWLDRTRARHLRVVAWYLPTLTDVGADLRRLQASAGLAGIDGIGVDVESRAVADPDDRSRRLVDLSRQIRTALAGRPLSAITLPNVATDVLNLDYWPRFPWAEIKPFYDVWQPMTYWTNRKSDSPYRDAELYTRENIERMRAKLGDPNAVVHPIGGIGDRATTADIEGFLRAVHQTRSIGASLYDWSTQSTTSYALMQTARS